MTDQHLELRAVADGAHLEFSARFDARLSEPRVERERLAPGLDLRFAGLDAEQSRRSGAQTAKAHQAMRPEFERTTARQADVGVGGRRRAKRVSGAERLAHPRRSPSLGACRKVALGGAVKLDEVGQLNLRATDNRSKPRPRP